MNNYCLHIILFALVCYSRVVDIVVVVHCEATTFPTQFIPVRQSSPSSSATLSSTNLTTYKDTYLHRNVYVIESTDQWSVVAPVIIDDDSTTGSDKKQTIWEKNPYNELKTSIAIKIQRKKWDLVRTSVQSRKHDCSIAINGGPYNPPDGALLGTVIINGTIVQKDLNSSYIGFGITKARRNGQQQQQQQYWIIGPIGTSIHPSKILHYLSGFDWLVYNGTNVVHQNNPNVSTGALYAPRTAIGVTATGSLLVLVFDGCEFWTNYRGPSLEYIANTLINHGAVYAINMDGGGSTTLVTKRSNGQHRIFNKPTCNDYPITCERPIATVMCLKFR